METLWTIHLLGGLSIQRTGFTALRLSLCKPNLILARLAFCLNRDVGRFELAEMLWPVAPADNGGHSLSVALQELRKLLEPEGVEHGYVLQADRRRLRLNPAAVTTDFHRLRESIDAARRTVDDEEYFAQMRAAVRLYGGELLPGADIDWVLYERENASALFMSYFQEFIDKLWAKGLTQEALHYAITAAELSPDDENLVERVLRLLLERKREEDAIKRFRAHSARLISTEHRLPCESIRRLMAPYKDRLIHNPPHVRAGAPANSQSEEHAHQPKPKAVPRQRAEIPTFFNEFFGREDEQFLVEKLLAPADHRHKDPIAPGQARLVTITGLGGCGKTRLAAETANRLVVSFDGHVLFVRLGGALRSDDVVHAVARALHLTGAERANIDLIAAKMRNDPWLLVLDGCERVAGCGGAAKLLLQAIPALTILATSRLPLTGGAERIIRLDPLMVPRSANSIESLSEFPSIQMFVSRAQAAYADFRMSDSNAPAISAIVESLEGVPLAIELVASRAGTLSPSQMLAEMVHGFVPTTAPSLISHNHPALKRTVEWSYRHLPEKAKRAFATLSVFRGGFTMEALRDITAATNTPEVLQRILDHSLLEAKEIAEVIRFTMLDSVREFAANRLEANKEALLRARHADYYLRLVRELAPRLRTPDQREAMAILDEERANIHAAIDFKRGEPDELRLIAAAWRYWYARGQISLGADLTTRALTVRARDLPEYAEALHGCGVFLDMQDDLAGAERALNESLALTHGIADQLQAHARSLSPEGA